MKMICILAVGILMAATQRAESAQPEPSQDRPLTLEEAIQVLSIHHWRWRLETHIGPRTANLDVFYVRRVDGNLRVSQHLLCYNRGFHSGHSPEVTLGYYQGRFTLFWEGKLDYASRFLAPKEWKHGQYLVEHNSQFKGLERVVWYDTNERIDLNGAHIIMSKNDWEITEGNPEPVRTMRECIVLRIRYTDSRETIVPNKPDAGDGK